MKSDAFVFYLGAHHADWLEKSDVPLFLSRRVLDSRRTLPRAQAPWALDSGGFSELSLHGKWMIEPRSYARLVARAVDEIGRLEWAAVEDWMCEATILRRTGLDVEEHQHRTIVSWLELNAIAPELPWLPILQGWTRGQYLDHLEAYARAGVDLTRQPLVGIGTMCRRQHTIRAALLIDELHEIGLRLHAFGFKTTGLVSTWAKLSSSDSLAWSLHARKGAPHPDCDHPRCSNCLRFALSWRDDLLAKLR